MKVDLTEEQIDWIKHLSGTSADEYLHKVNRPKTYNRDMAVAGLKSSLDVYNKFKSL